MAAVWRPVGPNPDGAGDYDGFMMKFDADLEFDGTVCNSGSVPGSEVADLRFDAQDVTANCHVFDSSGQWTVADADATVYDPGFWTWTCSAETDLDNDGVVDIEDNCPATANADQADGDADGTGNACDCDLDNDGTVSRADMSQFRKLWGTADEAADFSADGIVGSKRLFHLCAVSGERPTPGIRAIHRSSVYRFVTEKPLIKN